MFDARTLTLEHGGRWFGDRGVIPTPGHSRHDRGTILRDRDDGCGVHVQSFNGDWREARAALGLDDGGPTPRISELERRARLERSAREREEDAARRTAVARGLWAKAHPASGTVAEKYLQSRAIQADLTDADLRFLPKAPLYPYGDGSGPSFPAMVAAIRNTEGQLQATHITYLRPDGSRKAHLANPRKIVGPVGGGSIRLRKRSAGGGLIVGEGIESALSAYEAFAGSGRFQHPERWGVLAGINAGNLERLPVPDTRCALIAFDRDKNGIGETSARRLAERWASAGIRVGLLPPPEGCGDWNDHAQGFDQ